MHSPYSFQPRDRARERAKRAIQQRVSGGRTAIEEGPSGTAVGQATPPHPSTEETVTDTTVILLLHKIIENNRAFFSLNNLHKNAALLSRPIPTKLLWQNNSSDADDDDDDSTQPVLWGQDKLISFYGHAHVVEYLQHYLKGRQSADISLLDYALIFQRYHIVGALLLGGIHPTLGRGFNVEEQDAIEHHNKNNQRKDTWDQELVMTGRTVLQTIFHDRVPLPLSSYMVKRCFDLRWAYWKHYCSRTIQEESDNDVQQDTDDTTCQLCRRTGVPSSLCLLFDCSGRRRPPPQQQNHMICEPCYWKSTLERLNQGNQEEDVVVCPVCYPLAPCSSDKSLVSCVPSTSSWSTRQERYETSRTQFYNRLPKDRKALKQLDKNDASIHKNTNKNGRFILASNWADAVTPLTGHCQETRIDRFLGFVEKGLVHHVRGCITAGMDVNWKNQYGQTALYTASWLGHENVVGELLEAGADPNECDNAGTSPVDAAMSSNGEPIAALLHKYGGQQLVRDTPRLGLPVSSNNWTVQTLIPRSVDHPGAGSSYTIDGLLDEQSTQYLLEFWNTLPVAPGKIKAGPCSERRYFCDIHRVVVSILHDAVVQALVHTDKKASLPQPSDVIVLPFMRFLCYTEPGTILAPHVDLSRVDHATGTTSTHTFLLYLTDCVQGGATTLLHGLSGAARHDKLAVICPKRGRLLLFPHACPHEGEAVVDVPKVLIRGEVYLPDTAIP